MMRKTKMTALATMLAGGMLLGTSCTALDVRNNVVAGTLGYVKSGTTAFWNAVFPWDNFWAGVLGQTAE